MTRTLLVAALALACSAPAPGAVAGDGAPADNGGARTDQGGAPADSGGEQPGRAVATAVTGHVILLSVDGLHPAAITPAGAPTLHRLAMEGSHTFRATTIVPSTTLPAHTSLLSGLTPEVHGVTWNTDLVPLDGYAPFPTLFSAVAGAGGTTAAFLAKIKLRYLADPATVDHLSVPDNPMGFEYAAETMAKLEAYLATSPPPALLFLHLGDPDYAGHQHGWLSEPYRRAVRTVDDEVARLLELADGAYGPGAYTLVVTADHGGQGHDHGGPGAEGMEIPWIVWGKGVRGGEDVAGGVRTVDTAPTVLRALGIAAPAGMGGRVVESALTGPDAG